MRCQPGLKIVGWVSCHHFMRYKATHRGIQALLHTLHRASCVKAGTTSRRNKGNPPYCLPQQHLFNGDLGCCIDIAAAGEGVQKGMFSDNKLVMIV